METNQNEYKNVSEKPTDSTEIDNSTLEPFFCGERVELGCYPPITERFKVLLDSKKIIQQRLADALGFDKAYISRIIHGIEIPPHHVRIKIASYFGVDSSTIWRVEDLPYLKKITQTSTKKFHN